MFKIRPMKHILITILIVFVVKCEMNAQYSCKLTRGFLSPYLGNNSPDSGKKILGDGTVEIDEQLSSWQKLPFPFTFYGKKVSGYYASDNGYITFDSLATKSISINTSLPSSKAPSNCIFGLWQDLMIPAGSFVRTYTYGTYPHRIHVINWYYVVNKKSQNEWLAFSIRLHENEDFDVVFDYNGTSGSGKLNATLGCQSPDGKSGTMYGTSTTFNFPDSVNLSFYGTKYIGFISSGLKDLKLNSIDNLKNLYHNGDSILVNGTIENLSGDTVNNFALYYQVDALTPQKMNVSSANLDIYGVYHYHFSMSYVTTMGSHQLKVWIDSIIDSKKDGVLSNNSMSAFFATPKYDKNIGFIPLLEYATGAWCYSCPNGDGDADSLKAMHPDAPIVALHVSTGPSADSMSIPDANPLTNLYYGGIPSACFSRLPNEKQGPFLPDFSVDTDIPGYYWTKRYDQLLAEKIYAPASINISFANFDSVKKTIDISVAADFEDFAVPGDIRISLNIIENNMQGKGVGWTQRNGLYDTKSSPFYHVGTPDSGGYSSWINNYKHPHVLRAIVSNHTAKSYSCWGDSGIIPMIPVPGTTYSTTYKSVDLSKYNLKNVRVIAFMNYYNLDNLFLNTVINAAPEASLPGEVAAIENATTNDNFLNIYPNPSNGEFNVSFYLDKPEKASFKLYNNYGQEILSGTERIFEIGDNNIRFNIGNEPSGLYYLIIRSSSHSDVKKISLIK